MKTHIAINGACGRMGQRLVALAQEDSEMRVIAAANPFAATHASDHFTENGIDLREMRDGATANRGCTHQYQ